MKIDKNYWDAFFEQPQKIVFDYDGWLSKYNEYLVPGSRVLDLGCGSGINISILLHYKLNVTASDFSQNALEIVESQFPEVKTSCFDMTDEFPFHENSFDIVIADLSLHYFSWSNTNKIIDEVSRVLKSSGVLFARVHSINEIESERLMPIERNYYFVNGYNRRYFDIEDIQKLFFDWNINSVEEKEIYRYNNKKKVFEIFVTKR